MNTKILINKKSVRKNREIRKIQKQYKRENRDRQLDKSSSIKSNIEKVVTLSTEEIIGSVEECKTERETVLTEQELVEQIREARLTGLSGNEILTAEKISTFLDAAKRVNRKIIIINGVECEPGLLHDAWLLRHKKKEIARGAAYLGQAIQPERIILAVKGTKEWKACWNLPGVKTVRVPLKYPMGEEHILIKQLLGMTLDPGSIPATEGILVINVQTVYQIGHIVDGCYDGGRFVTLANLMSGEGRVAYVNHTQKVDEVLEHVFGRRKGIIYAGGGVMYAAKAKAGQQFTNQISFAAVGQKSPVSDENLCKGCGACTKRCPMGVSVKDIVKAKEKNPSADISMWNPEKCIQCGTCTYFCRAGKNVNSYVTE